MFWISHLLQNFEATKLIKNTLIKKKKKMETRENGCHGQITSFGHDACIGSPRVPDAKANAAQQAHVAKAEVARVYAAKVYIFSSGSFPLPNITFILDKSP